MAFPYQATAFIDTYLDPTSLRITLSDQGLQETDWNLEHSHISQVGDRYETKIIFKSALRLQLAEKIDNTSRYIMCGDVEKTFLLSTEFMPLLEEAEAFMRKVVYELTSNYYEYMENK